MGVGTAPTRASWALGCMRQDGQRGGEMAGAAWMATCRRPSRPARASTAQTQTPLPTEPPRTAEPPARCGRRREEHFVQMVGECDQTKGYRCKTATCWIMAERRSAGRHAGMAMFLAVSTCDLASTWLRPCCVESTPCGTRHSGSLRSGQVVSGADLGLVEPARGSAKPAIRSAAPPKGSLAQQRGRPRGRWSRPRGTRPMRAKPPMGSAAPL